MSLVIENLHTFSHIWNHPHGDREKIILFQNRKLRSVITHAYKNVRYYRELFDRAGIRPQDIRTAEDLSIVPLTSSQDYRIRPLSETFDMKIKRERTVCRATSGSAGRPFIIRRTFFEDHLINCFRIRAHRQFGIRAGDKIAHIRILSQSHERANILGKLRQASGIYRDYPVNSMWSAEDIMSKLELLKPDILKGYPSVIAHIASFVNNEGTAKINPRFVVSGGESLSPFRRQNIEHAFGKRVFDIYGSHEFNLLAWECPERGQYHVCDDNVILEILRNGRPARVGERGEVVATALHSYAMPFIRYRLGDIVTRGPETCSCGQPFSTLRTIQGRMHDYFRMPDGTFLHPDVIIVPIMENESSWFDRYHLIQKEEELVVLRVQPFRRPREDELAHVRQLGEDKLPSDVAFQIEVVENLPVETGGKFRFCKSMVNSHCEDIDWESL